MLFQCCFGVTNGVSNVAGSMQHIGSNHHIVASQLDPLFRERLLHVKPSICQIGMVYCISPLAVMQKSFGNITVTVLCDRCLIRLQHLQNLACGSPRASTDLQDTNACVFIVSKPILHIDHEKSSQDLIEVVSSQMLLIDPLYQIRGTVGKHRLSG